MNRNRTTRSMIFAASLLLCGATQMSIAAEAEGGAVATPSCVIPTTPAKSAEETAWRLFVAINCNIANNQLTWETWKTQACINNPTDCPTNRLHGSLLRSALVTGGNPNDPKRTGGCNPMTTAASAPAPLLPFVPKNLSVNPEFCEEVTINSGEENYANANGLLTVSGQMKFLQSGGTINFPTTAIEVKADWVAASSFTGIKFDCKAKNSSVYQEMINGECYALVGMHISSKLYPNWVWATFEPQDPRTNPNRCNPSLYNECIDTWGSKPATSKGAKTGITPALKNLFSQAGNKLDSSFQNYRLTGTQTDFNQPVATQGNLGSSFVEFNAQVLPKQASCITCHSYAQRVIPGSAPAGGGTPPGSAPAGSPNVGTPNLPVPVYKSLDFSWFLGFGVPK